MKRQYDFHVYIDEFGDEGFGKLRSHYCRKDISYPSGTFQRGFNPA